jgi:hypothetical protein
MTAMFFYPKYPFILGKIDFYVKLYTICKGKKVGQLTNGEAIMYKKSLILLVATTSVTVCLGNTNLSLGNKPSWGWPDFIVKNKPIIDGLIHVYANGKKPCDCHKRKWYQIRRKCMHCEIEREIRKEHKQIERTVKKFQKKIETEYAKKEDNHE